MANSVIFPKVEALNFERPGAAVPLNSARICPDYTKVAYLYLIVERTKHRRTMNFYLLNK